MKVSQLPKSEQNGHPLRPDQGAVDGFWQHLLIPLIELSLSIGPEALDCISEQPCGVVGTAYHHKQLKVLAAAALKLGFDDDIGSMLKSFHLTRSRWQFMENHFEHAQEAISDLYYMAALVSGLKGPIETEVAGSTLGYYLQASSSDDVELMLNRDDVALMLTSHDPNYIDDVADDLLKGGI